MALAGACTRALARAASHYAACSSVSMHGCAGLGAAGHVGAGTVAAGAARSSGAAENLPRAARSFASSEPPASPGPGSMQPRPTSGALDGVPASVVRDLQPPAKPYDLLPLRPMKALYTPWTPTRLLQRRAKIARRMKFLVHQLERERVPQVRQARPLPRFGAGDILEVRVVVPEVDRKEVVYRGICIARYDKGLRSAFKIYNVYPEGGGIVQHLPMYMPDLLSVKVVGRVPVKQQRLYYLLEQEGQAREHMYQTAPEIAAS